MSVNLNQHKELFNKKAFAHLATIMPDGSPQTTPVWFDLENGYIRINTAEGRQKDLNMRRNDKVALSIMDPENSYTYVTIRGKVAERIVDEVDAHIDGLAKKYLGADKYPYRDPNNIRIIYKIKPLKVSGYP